MIFLNKDKKIKELERENNNLKKVLKNIKRKVDDIEIRVYIDSNKYKMRYTAVKTKKEKIYRTIKLIQIDLHYIEGELNE